MSQTDKNPDESGVTAEDLKAALAEKRLELKSKTDEIKQAKYEANKAERLSNSAQKEFDKEQKEGSAQGCGAFAVKYGFLLPLYFVLVSNLVIMAILGVTDGLSIDNSGWFNEPFTERQEGAHDTTRDSVVSLFAVASFLFFFTFLPFRARVKKKAERQRQLDTDKEEVQKLKLRIKKLGVEKDKIQEEIEAIRSQIDDVKAEKLSATEQELYLKSVARLKLVEELAEEKRNDWLTKSESSYKKLKSVVDAEIDQLAELSERHPSIGNFLMTRSIDDDNLDVFQRLDAIFDDAAKVESE